jgi:hypothetical protein
VNFIAAGWQAYGLKYERYRTHAIHDTSDPETIIVEQEVLGTSASTGEFTLPNIVVLTARNGQINAPARLRQHPGRRSRHGTRHLGAGRLTLQVKRRGRGACCAVGDIGPGACRLLTAFDGAQEGTGEPRCRRSS